LGAIHRDRVGRKLTGADDGNRQMVDILTAMLTDGLSAVEAACAEATAHGVHSADVVLNIPARHRNPGPPATVLTPAALTLRHAPIADCARYDNLRGKTLTPFCIRVPDRPDAMRYQKGRSGYGGGDPAPATSLYHLTAALSDHAVVALAR
jgi:hypothetical protein